MMTRFDDRRLASSCVLYTIPIDIGHPATARMLIRTLFANLHTIDKQLFLAAIRNARSSPLSQLVSMRISGCPLLKYTTSWTGKATSHQPMRRSLGASCWLSMHVCDSAARLSFAKIELSGSAWDPLGSLGRERCRCDVVEAKRMATLSELTH